MTYFSTSKSQRIRPIFLKASFFLLSFFIVETAFAQATLSKSFFPNSIGPGSVSTATFTISNGAATSVTGISFTDVLPSTPGPMTIATPANVVTTCDAGPSGTLVASDGGSTITLTDFRLGALSSCTISVDVTASTAGAHTNPAVTLSSSSGSSMSLPADLTVLTTRPGFSKSFAPSSIPFGGRSTLTFTIDNTLSASRVGNLDFTDNFPAGLVVASPANASTDCISGSAPDTTITAAPGSNSVKLDANGNTIFAGFETLPAGATCSVTVDVTSTGVGQLKNITSDLLADFTSAGKASATLEVTRTELSIRQSFIDDPVSPGGTSTLEFTIDNFNRNFAATGVAFTNDLTTLVPSLSGLSYDSLISNDCGGSVAGVGTTSIGFSGGTIAAQSFCTIQVSLSVPVATSPGVYTNSTSTVTGTIDGSPVIGNTSSDTLNAEPVPILTVEFLESGTLTPDPIVDSGEAVVIRYSITNPSTTSAATAVAFIDELTQGSSISGFFPFPVSVVSPTLPSTECGGGSVALVFVDTDRQGISLTNGAIAASSSCTFDVQVTIPADVASGIQLNTTGMPTATIDGATRTGSAASDTLNVVAAPALSKSFTDSPVAPGSTVTLEYTLTHSSNASTDATAISFTDDLAMFAPAIAGITANLPATPAPQCGAGSTLVGSAGDTFLTLTGGVLTPGESCTFSVTINVPVSATSGAFTSTSSNVMATVSGRAVQAPAATATLDVGGLVFTTKFLTNPALPSESLTLRFDIENISGTAATGIGFTNSLFPIAAGLIATDPALSDTCGGTLTIVTVPGIGSLLTYASGTLAAASSCQLDVEVTVPPTASDGVYQNVTSALSYTISALPGAVGAAINDLVVQTNDRLTLSKSFTNTPVIAGGSALVTYVISNPDDSKTATGVSFADDFGSVITGLQLTGLDLPSDCASTGGAVISGFNTPVFSVSSLTLAPGASCTIVATVDVPITAATGTYASSTSGLMALLDGLAVTGSAASSDLAVVNLDISFTKSFGVSSLVAGGSTTIDYSITNNDASGLIRLSFTDDLDSLASGLVATNLPLNDVCGTGSSVTGTSTISLLSGNLGAGETCVFSVQITVPTSATPGVLTSTTSELEENSLEVEAGAAANITITPIPLSFSKAFSPDIMISGGTSTLQFTINNSASAISATALDFTDNLPAGLVVASTPNASTTCTGGTITATAGTSVISYVGGSVASFASCTVSVDTTTMIAATYNNVSGDLTSSYGNGGTAADSLQVKGAGFTKSFASGQRQAGESTSLSFTITNSSASDMLNDLSFTDNLDSVLSGLIVSTSLPANDVCGTGSVLSNLSGLHLAGGSLPAGGSCTFSVNLMIPANAMPGNYINTTSGLTSNHLLIAAPASDTLFIVDNDTDNDTIPNTSDNCPTVSNTDQADLDSDGLGNACDNDSDNDLLPDDYEIANGLDPLNSFDQQGDPDGDGFTNLEEFRFGSNPNVADVDENNNGVPDSVDQRRMHFVVPAILMPLLLSDDTAPP